ncbi:MAG: hypothetical protein QF552_01305 [Litorilituus sp.]|jgi:hypothetical protein|nr:hypothetical protein [Litorilituus sp.]
MKRYASFSCLALIAFILSFDITHAEAVLIKPALYHNNTKSLYIYSDNSAGLLYRRSVSQFKPIIVNLTANNQTIDDRKENLISQHNSFFEFTMIFHDRIHQFITIFTRDNDTQAINNNI